MKNLTYSTEARFNDDVVTSTGKVLSMRKVLIAARDEGMLASTYMEEKNMRYRYKQITLTGEIDCSKVTPEDIIKNLAMKAIRIAIRAKFIARLKASVPKGAGVPPETWDNADGNYNVDVTELYGKSLDVRKAADRTRNALKRLKNVMSEDEFKELIASAK